jgi:uncharacterized protein
MRRARPADQSGEKKVNALPQHLEPNGISVTGEATQKVVPDFADVAVAVEVSGQSAQRTLIESNFRMQRISAAAVNIGVQAEDMQTSGLRLDPLYPPSPQSAPTGPMLQGAAAGDASQAVIIGYHASSTLRISFEATRIGELVDALVSAGANRIVAGPIFRLRDESDARRLALARAAKNARDKAEIIAIALAKKLGDPIVIREEMAFLSSMLLPFSTGPGSLGIGALTSNPVSPGELAYQARVNVIYEFS